MQIMFFCTHEKQLVPDRVLPRLNILLFPHSSTSQEDDEDEFYHIIDKTALEQWRLSGLPSDTFFTENAIAIQESAK